MFDAYYKWLGIPPRDQPPNYYRLLNIDLFESDLDVIEGAADRAMGYVRQYQSGEQAALAAKLLNEISTARLCLLKPDAKSTYDAKLRQELSAVTAPERKRKPKPTERESADPDAKEPLPSRRPSTSRKEQKKTGKNSSLPLIWGGIAGTFAVVIVAVLLRGNVASPPSAPSVESPAPATTSIKEPDTSTQTSTIKDQSDSALSVTVPATPIETPALDVKPPSTSSPTKSTEKWQSGFLCQLFGRPDLTKFVQSRVDNAINFQFGLDAPETGLPEDEFSIRWLGAIQTPVAGKYGFQIAHDDGVRVWIDDRKVVDQWLTGSSSERFEVDLTAGWHQFRLDYFDKSDLAAIAVRWKPPGKEFEPFRGDFIRHNPAWSGRKDWDRLETPDRASPPDNELLTSSNIKTAQYRESKTLGMPVEFTNSIGMPLRLIPPGQFLMGSPSTDPMSLPNETPQVRVSLTQPFFLGQFEVTQREWRRVMETSPWKSSDAIVANDNHPAVMMDWHEMRTFCDKLTEMDLATKLIKPDWYYSLPTEAQWEFASRGGTTDRFGASEDALELLETDWVRQNCIEKKEPYAHPVGKKKANPFDCYDLLGNVSEACRDRYAFELLEGNDPLKFCATEYYVRRGGSWTRPTTDARIARRAAIHEREKSSDYGFRVCLSAGRLDADPKVSPFRAAHSLTIRGIVDGDDDFRIYPDRIELIHHSWAIPEHLTVNDVPWRNRPKPFVLKNGPLPVALTPDPTLIEFQNPIGRSPVTYKRLPDYIEVSVRDGATGGGWYEFTISWEPPQK